LPNERRNHQQRQPGRYFAYHPKADRVVVAAGDNCGEHGDVEWKFV
jgi:hypothetical protein